MGRPKAAPNKPRILRMPTKAERDAIVAAVALGTPRPYAAMACRIPLATWLTWERVGEQEWIAGASSPVSALVGDCLAAEGTYRVELAKSQYSAATGPGSNSGELAWKIMCKRDAKHWDPGSLDRQVQIQLTRAELGETTGDRETDKAMYRAKLEMIESSDPPKTGTDE